MLREEFNGKCAELLGVESPETAKISALVTELKEAFSNIQTELELAAAEVAALKTQNKDLKEQNMQLFLKVTTEPEQTEKPQTPKPSYDSLFDENGRLK